MFLKEVLLCLAICQADSTQQSLHEETQRERASRGLAPQQLDDELCRLCQRWAQHMARTGRFSHGGGENVIAYGASTPSGAIRMWLGSPPHRAFLLGGATKAGWGAARSPSGTWYWAGAFRGEAILTEPTTYRPSRRGLFRRR